MAEGATRVLIVDDQVLYREGLAELMRHWPEFEVVGEASNGAEAVEFCRRDMPDMVLMDVQMPVMNGIEATSVIAGAHPGANIIMLTVGVEDEVLFSALAAGAKGYVLKDMPSRQLRNRLQGAVRGEAALSGAVATKLVEKVSRQSFAGVDAHVGAQSTQGLTEREIQILRLVAQGLSNEEIGAVLYLSAGMIKKHLRMIMQKYGFENRVQIAVFAVRSGLVK